jgi:hypothetical protein
MPSTNQVKIFGSHTQGYGSIIELKVVPKLEK